MAITFAIENIKISVLPRSRLATLIERKQEALSYQLNKQYVGKRERDRVPAQGVLINPNIRKNISSVDLKL
jgi:hypothetical protein